MNSDQRILAVASTIAAPVIGLAFAAARNEGAFRRSGKVGLVGGLLGSLGFASFWAAESSYRERPEAALSGCVFGGAIGLSAGVLGSLAREALR